MTDTEIRTDVATALLGASITLGLIVDGLRGRIEPAVFSDAEHAALHRALVLTHEAGEALAEMGRTIRERAGR